MIITQIWQNVSNKYTDDWHLDTHKTQTVKSGKL